MENVFPLVWKRAIIKPLCKISKPEELKDLRPISILPVVSKIVEKHVYQQICSFVNTANIIPDCQSGFRKNFSTTTSLVNLLNEVRCNEEKKERTCLGLLDFSKAFDTLNHEMLLAKLHFFGLSDNSIKFFKAYLSNRAHCVVVKKECSTQKSNYIPMTTGVPQGSILGPLLFSLYVADMNNFIEHSKLQQYADDSQVYISFSLENSHTAQANFISDLDNINSFAVDHNLKLNATKSCIIFLGSNRNNLNILDNFNVKINNVPVPVVKEAKNLGVYFDTGLTFQTHIKNKLKIAYMRLKKLYYLKTILPSKTKYYLCETLILSLFDYGDVVYNDSLTVQLSYAVQKVQNACMRFSFIIPFRNHITPYLNNNSILNMKNRRNYHMYTFVYRIIKNGKPPYLRKHFNSYSHPHHTRNMHYFTVPQHRTANFQKSFVFVAVQLWNNLNNNVKEFSPNKFNKYIKKHLLEIQRSEV